MLKRGRKLLLSAPGRAAGAAVLLALLPVRALAAGNTAGATASNVPWYLSRAAGIVAYLLLFLTVALGLAIRTKALDRALARWRVTDLHGFLSVLCLLFVAVHAAVLLADAFIGYSIGQILIPFASPYEPFWTGLGVLMAYLLLLVALSFPARRLIGYRAWRMLHYLTFAAYLGALAHAIFSGGDSQTRWAQAIYLASAGVIAALLLYRIVAWDQRAVATLIGRFQRQPAAQRADEFGAARAALHLRALAFATTVAGAAFLLAVAAGVGPFHWLHGASGDAARGDETAPVGARAPAATGFHDRFSGTLLSSRAPGGSLSLQLRGSGEREVLLAMQVQMGGGASGILGSSATLTDAAGALLCAGKVTALSNDGFSVDCQGAGLYAGRALSLRGAFSGSSGTQLQGTLDASVG